jgi:hypothetical protein
MAIEIGETFRHKESRCPACAHQLDASTATEGEGARSPEPGDCTICLNCASVLMFRDDMTVRLATPTELREAEESQPETFKKLRKVGEAVTLLIQRRHSRSRVRVRWHSWN